MKTIDLLYVFSVNKRYSYGIDIYFKVHVDHSMSFEYLQMLYDGCARLCTQGRRIINLDITPSAWEENTVLCNLSQ